MTGSPVPGQGQAATALDELEPPSPQGPLFPYPSLTPWLNRELDTVVGKHLYSAHVSSSLGQEEEVGGASATGTAGTAQSWPGGRGTGAPADGLPEGIS